MEEIITDYEILSKLVTTASALQSNETALVCSRDLTTDDLDSLTVERARLLQERDKWIKELCRDVNQNSDRL